MREWNSTQSTRSKEAEKLLYFHVAGKVMTAPWFYGSNRSVNRVTKIEYPGALVGDEGFGYDDAGGLLWKKDGNAKFTLYEYDDLRRLIAIYYLPGALPNPISYEGLTAGVTYTYNGGTNQRETMTDAAGTSAFEYDAQGRLSQYTPPLGLDTGYYVEYAYNNAGQKTGVKIWNGTTASYDVSYEYYANGWLKAVKSGAQTMASYSYDDNGALMAVKTADGQTEQESFTYYPSGLMNAATLGTQTLMNLWDADEHRVQFSIGENNYTAVFDVTAGIPAVIKEVTPQGTVYYVREPGGELICRVVGESRWYYHFDELGSTRLLTNSTGAVTDRYSYDAYGAVISHDRNTGTIAQPYQYVGQFGYYTHYDAPEFGWLQLGVRFYEPETGRFERRDSVPSLHTSRYRYAASAPLVYTDPTGYWPGLRPIPAYPDPTPLRPGCGVAMGCASLAGRFALGFAWDAMAALDCEICCVEIENYINKLMPTATAGRSWSTQCATACATSGGFVLPWRRAMPRRWYWW